MQRELPSDLAASRPRIDDSAEVNQRYQWGIIQPTRRGCEPMAQAAAIFVSHAHEDTAWCRTFVHVLRDAGAQVWYDEHNLGYGAITEEIERELRARPIFIVIVSPASVEKAWVRREMTAAITMRDREPSRIILPVVAAKAEIPLFWDEFKRI